MTKSTERKLALIVGGSRGLGLGLVEACLSRGWQVIATVRDSPGRAVLTTAGAGKENMLSIMHLDINMPAEIATLRNALAGQHLDVLFINAGVANDPEAAVESVPTEEFMHVMVTNPLGPLRVMAACHDLVKADGVIAAMSSNMGSVSGNQGGGWEVYRASKAALNQLIRSFGARHQDGKTYLAVSPGWVRTEMGGETAPLDIATSANGIVDTITARAGIGGVHFVDYSNRTIAW
jgi:NAD(P)-dependent dehydrogenase (short-subunit alcohol dehydrogenase family)